MTGLTPRNRRSHECRVMNPGLNCHSWIYREQSLNISNELPDAYEVTRTFPRTSSGRSGRVAS